MEALGANALWIALIAIVLAVVFLVLWLRARSGGGENETKKQLRAAQNQIQLLKGDQIQAKREQAQEIEKREKELETLRAVAGGKIPPELEQWKQRALAAEQKLESELERHREEIEKVIAAVGSGGSADQTMISPGGAADRLETLEKELAEAKGALEAATARYDAEIAALSERLNAEKAAALTAQSRRHAQEIEAVKAGREVSVPVTPDTTAMEADDGRVPEAARFAMLLAEAGTAKGQKFHLPYDMATLGRADTNTVVLQEGMASRVHAEIRFDGKEFKLTDRNSTNGTQLNGELVNNATLKFGDVVGIGETQLKFTCEAAETASKDPEFAEAAYEAMIRLAPTCRPALQGLKQLVERDPGRAEEVRAIETRLNEASAG